MHGMRLKTRSAARARRGCRCQPFCGGLASSADAKYGRPGPRPTAASHRRLQGRDRLLADGPALDLRRPVHPGPALRARVRDEGHQHRQRAQDRADARRRRHRSGQGRLGREGPDRQGLQDPRRHRLVGRRAPDGAARGAEQDPLHLRPRRDGRGHRDQQVHVPLGPPDLSGRQDLGDVPQGRRPEGRRLRAGLGVRRRQLRRRERGRRRPGPQRSAGSSCRSRRRTSRRSRSRPSRRTRTCSSSPGPARPGPRCTARSRSRACSASRTRS